MSREITQNYTQKPPVDAVKPTPPGITPEQKEKQIQEQERTRTKKKLFLEYFANSMGIVTIACQKVEIERKTYYNWRRTDPDFAAAIRTIESGRNDEVEDRLFQKIREGEGASIRFYLEKKHPEYKNKGLIGLVTPKDGKTFEDLLDEFEAAEDNETNEQTDQQTNNGAGIPDTEQAGRGSAIQVKQSPAVLPKQTDTPQHNNKGPAKRD